MTLTRRDLLALTAAMPGFGAIARHVDPARSAVRTSLPWTQNPAQDDETMWERIAGEFLIDGMHLNTGTYGACPVPVIEATVHHLRAFERIIGQEALDMPAMKSELESFLGAWPGSVAIQRNTTEAMNLVAQGLDLAPGDEVLSTTHEHIGGRCCWEQLAKRRGVVYRTFDPPLNPRNDQELLDAWQAHVTPKTKVLSISHVLFSTGMVQPVAALVKWARARGIVSVIDGAHPPGMLVLDLQAIDADFYATSTHKWLLGPKGTGLLIVRPDRLQTTWPLVASGDWSSNTIARFEHVGTSNDALVAGLRAAVTFQHAIGSSAIERRVRFLATRLYAGLLEVPGITVVTPSRPELRAGMVSFTMAGTTAEALQAYLGRYRIRVRRIAEFGLEYVRLSTHVYVLPRDVDRAVALLRLAPRA